MAIRAPRMKDHAACLDEQCARAIVTIGDAREHLGRAKIAIGRGLGVGVLGGMTAADHEEERERRNQAPIVAAEHPIRLRRVRTASNKDTKRPTKNETTK